MEMNDAGLALIKSFEGCRLTVYKDIVGLLTVGYGHRTDLPEGTTITQDQADDLLMQDLAKFEAGVAELVEVPLTDNQFSALVCFSYNLGLGALKSSLLLKCLNTRNYKDAADQFLVWDKAKGVIVPGLARRRKAEQDLFLATQ